MPEANLNGNNKDVAARALCAAVRRSQFEPVHADVTIAGKYVRVTFPKATTIFEASPDGARQWAAALNLAADRIEGKR